MKWDRAVSNYKKHCIVVSNTHLISTTFSLQTPFAIALMAMAMAGEGSYEVGGRGGRSPRNGWLSKVVYPASHS